MGNWNAFINGIIIYTKRKKLRLKNRLLISLQPVKNDFKKTQRILQISMFVEEFSGPYFSKRNLLYHPETENILRISGKVK